MIGSKTDDTVNVDFVARNAGDRLVVDKEVNHVSPRFYGKDVLCVALPDLFDDCIRLGPRHYR